MSAAGPGHGHAITVDSKNRIVLAGTQNAATKSYFAIARYQPDGKLDQSFNGGGRLVDTTSATDQLWAVTTQDDGKIVAAGGTGASPTATRWWAATTRMGLPTACSTEAARRSMSVARTSPWASRCSPATRCSSCPRATPAMTGSFGSPPRAWRIRPLPAATFPSASRRWRSAPDGKIVLGGSVLDNGNDACAIARFNADGSADTGFGNGAAVLTRAVPNSPCVVEAAAIAPDGKIVAGEHTGEYPHERAAISRYQVDPDPVGGTAGGNGGSGGSTGTTSGSDGTAGGSDGTAGAGAGAQGSGAAAQTPSSAAALTLSGLKVTNRRFTVNRVVTPRVGPAQAARRAKRGTAFAFALNRAATVAIRIDRVGKGRKTRVVARLKRTAAAGGNSVSFSGHLGRRLLGAGSYRATFTAVDTSGNRTKPQAVKFRILRG